MQARQLSPLAYIYIDCGVTQGPQGPILARSCGEWLSGGCSSEMKVQVEAWHWHYGLRFPLGRKKIVPTESNQMYQAEYGPGSGFALLRQSSEAYGKIEFAIVIFEFEQIIRNENCAMYSLKVCSQSGKYSYMYIRKRASSWPPRLPSPWSSRRGCL